MTIMLVQILGAAVAAEPLRVIQTEKIIFIRKWKAEKILLIIINHKLDSMFVFDFRTYTYIHVYIFNVKFLKAFCIAYFFIFLILL